MFDLKSINVNLIAIHNNLKSYIIFTADKRLAICLMLMAFPAIIICHTTLNYIEIYIF